MDDCAVHTSKAGVRAGRKGMRSRTSAIENLYSEAVLVIIVLFKLYMSVMAFPK